MFRIAHVSDTHGTFPELGSAVAVFHTGDFLPNSSRGIVEREVPFQRNWVADNLDTIRTWLGGRMLVFCEGNHDFYNPVQTLLDAGINAVDATHREVNVMGQKIYGFPFIPWIKGEWNHETQYSDMIDKVEKIPPDLDILMAHCPPAGILCEDGNTALANWISYGSVTNLPKMLLCGHFHDTHGISQILLDNHPGILVSNAATTVHYIEVP